MTQHERFPEAGVYRFDTFVFDPATGELQHDRQTAASDLPPDGAPLQKTIKRLPPKPALLLVLLLERRGALLTHDQIRAALWPDVTVEFDQALHFCMRQVRAALGDRASAPRFIETLPRRGYRWICDIDAPAAPDSGGPSSADSSFPKVVPDESDSSDQAITPTPPGTRLKWSRSAALIALLLAVWIAAASFRSSGVIHVAVMPFASPAGADVPVDTRQIATLLVGALSSDARFGVVGPTTTAQLADGDVPLRTFIDANSVHFILNARFAERDGRVQMLIELVRTSDGVHVWVQWFDDFGDLAAVAEVIEEHAVLAMLQQPGA